jgi:hypothetical protein
MEGVTVGVVVLWSDLVAAATIGGEPRPLPDLKRWVVAVAIDEMSVELGEDPPFVTDKSARLERPDELRSS